MRFLVWFVCLQILVSFPLAPLHGQEPLRTERLMIAPLKRVDPALQRPILSLPPATPLLAGYPGVAVEFKKANIRSTTHIYSNQDIKDGVVRPSDTLDYYIDASYDYYAEYRRRR